MAQLSGTQKKQKNTFIVLLIAIVVVLAAIAYVLYGGLTSKSALLDNQDFAAALSETLGKAPAFIGESELANVKYLAVSYDANEKSAMVVTGGDEFVTRYEEYMAQVDAAAEDEEVTQPDLSAYVKMATFSSKEVPTLDDVKYFTGLKRIELSGISVSDSSVFAGMTGLTSGLISGCGLTEVNGLAGLDAEAVDTLYVTGNNIEDWSGLDYIADKVIVNSGYQVLPSEDGTFDINNLQYVEQTLAELKEEEAAKADTNKNDADNADNADDATDVDNADNADNADDSDNAPEADAADVENTDDADNADANE